MRLVADTNVVIAGLLWPGRPRLILDAARNGSVQLFVTIPLLIELEDVLRRDKFAARLDQRQLRPHNLVVGYAALASLVAPAEIAPVIVEDPDDDMVLACAIAGQVDAIVSGDKHLLGLSSYRNIPILTVAALLARVGARD